MFTDMFTAPKRPLILTFLVITGKTDEEIERDYYLELNSQQNQSPQEAESKTFHKKYFETFSFAKKLCEPMFFSPKGSPSSYRPSHKYRSRKLSG